MKGLPKSQEEGLASKDIKNDRGKKYLKLIFITILSVVCLSLTSIRVLIINQYNLWPPHRYKPYLASGYNGAVASETETCSKMGIDVLNKGGNAADAAVSTTLCIGVMNMFSSGIGGGGFALIRTPEGNISSLDFRETAPGSSYPFMFVKHPMKARVGGLANATPGELAGLFELHSRYGKLNWHDLVMLPSELSKGWKVTKELARRIYINKDWILLDPIWTSFLAPTGKPLREGDWIKRPNYSKTLKRIADEGIEPFYNGDIGESFANASIEHGGILTMDDFNRYSVKLDESYNTHIDNLSIHTTGFPTSGPVLLFMLNMLDNFDMIPPRINDSEDLHNLIETMKFGFAERTRIGDLPFMNDTEPMLRMLDKEYANQISQRVTPETHTWEYYNPDYEIQETHGTTHITIVDKEGGVVSLTSTVNGVFGSRVLDPNTGIILNNEMDDFSIPGHPNLFGLWPSKYNLPEPYKRPLSSTSPTIVENSKNGKLITALGGSGGSRIFGSVMQTLLHILQGYDVSESIELPRVHDQVFPHVVSFESGFNELLIKDMKKRGHNTTVFDFNLGLADVQAVSINEDGKMFAASDSRKGGIAAAY